MAKTKNSIDDTETETEAAPLAVVTREPSDEELMAELAALGDILQRYSPRRAEYAHAATNLESALVWIRRATIPLPTIMPATVTTEPTTP